MSAVQTESRDTPRDGYGAGHTAYLLRTHFRDLCREIGEAKARAETLEMIDDETEGSSRHG